MTDGVSQERTLTLSSIFKWLKRHLRFVEDLGDYGSLCFDVIKIIVTRPPPFRLVLKQLYDIGAASVVLVTITGLSTGLVLATQAIYQLSDKGLVGLTGLLVAKAMITELGPVITSFMITGRVGAAICAELGAMRVSEQIDALQTMAVNPRRYLAAPRLLAGTLVMPFLSLFSMVTGIIGGYLISVYFFGMTPAAYFNPIPINISMFDLFTGFMKAFVFGLLMMTIACYKGMKATGGAAGVGLATTRSVVLTYCCILFANFFLTLALNMLRVQL